MIKPTPIDEATLQRLIQQALDEDGLDRTTTLLLAPQQHATATLLSKASGIFCGCFIAEALAKQMSPALRIRWQIQDGEAISIGQSLAKVEGDLSCLLRWERPTLNFLQHLSGVATQTAAFVKAVAGTGMQILDTRKTLPGWRALQKYAVVIGGGQNHRHNLHSMLLIKDNHIQAIGSLLQLVEKIRLLKEAHADLFIEVEVTSLEQLQVVLKAPVDRIMLDNFSPSQVEAAVAEVAGRVPLEVSGGLDLQSIAAYAHTGVQFASVGRLTHSVMALDMSLEID